ncbi:MAG TPA: cupin domain-containing protein [Dermatophilaceae bacterium]|nr:cupin domain-containing protein [Dermatophilaceae bacterium]
MLPHHSASGQGTQLAALDAVHTVKIGAAETEGLYELFEIDVPRGHTVPPHRHAWLEAYYVLHGRMGAHVDDTGYELGPGSSLTVPPYALHTLSPLSPSLGFLVFTLTDAMGAFFADLDRHVPHGRPLEDVVPLVLEVAGRHGVTFSGPGPS